jgi:toxin-antitoxin system PIN domain toxin
LSASPAGTVTLLDANVLVALADAAHVHHASAAAWFKASSAPFATCPITQGALLRVLLRLQTVADAASGAKVLAGFSSHPRHRFWPDSLEYTALPWAGVVGHRQVTDAYLAALARHHRGKLATFDRGLAALHADVTVLIAA